LLTTESHLAARKLIKIVENNNTISMPSSPNIIKTGGNKKPTN